jgi:hypothetical protein
MDSRTRGELPDQNQTPSRPIAIWLVAIVTWIAICVYTARTGRSDLTQLLLNFLIANFQSLPGLLFTTLSRNRKSAFRRWNAATLIVQIPGLLLWIAHAFEPTLTGSTAGPMAGFSIMPLIMIVYILGAFGLFFLVAIPDIIGQMKTN